ncbi:MAG TPA: histidine phosphatase family protein [Steroidobacteraceae bacterium]|nr:histidine phosphatase family protein [Steroidobacteraceae bacterium]
MKRLTLLRHANADWKDSRTADFDRPLNRKGLSEATAMARRLFERELVPELVLTSPAVRAQQTTEIFMGELELPPRKLRRDERLYLAQPEDVLEAIRAIGPRISHLMVVGHNPGLTEAARRLAPGGTLEELPTAAFCTMLFDTRTWVDVEPGMAREVECEAPKGGFRLWDALSTRAR